MGSQYYLYECFANTNKSYLQVNPKWKLATISPTKNKKKAKVKAPTLDTSGEPKQPITASPSAQLSRTQNTTFKWMEYKDDTIEKDMVTILTATTGDTKTIAEEHVVNLRRIVTAADDGSDTLDFNEEKGDISERKKKNVSYQSHYTCGTLKHGSSAHHPKIL